LTDGFLADGDEAGSAGWIGWERGRPIHVLIDLGKPTKITSVGGHFLRAAGGIGFPARVDFSISDDGKSFRKVATVLLKKGSAQRGWYIASVKGVMARHVRINPTPGSDWTFLDEVVVNPQLPAPTFKHAAQGKPVTLAYPPAEVYSASGIIALTDGYIARSPDFMNPEWLGIEGKNLEATIDMGLVMDIHEVGCRFLQHVGAGIRIPQTLDILISDDGKAFRKIATVKHQQNETSPYITTLGAKLKGVKGRFVRVVAYTNGQWLFTDEVFVNPKR
jgi:hypothetical protein